MSIIIIVWEYYFKYFINTFISIEIEIFQKVYVYTRLPVSQLK